MERLVTLDLLGDEVKPGDWVICNKKHYYELGFGRVISITPKGFVNVTALDPGQWANSKPIIRYDFVRMSDKQVKALESFNPELFKRSE